MKPQGEGRVRCSAWLGIRVKSLLFFREVNHLGDREVTAKVLRLDGDKQPIQRNDEVWGNIAGGASKRCQMLKRELRFVVHEVIAAMNHAEAVVV